MVKWKFDHIGITVKNLDDVLKFYSKTFEWQLPKGGVYSKIHSVDLPDYKLKYAMLSTNIRGPPYIEFFEPAKGPYLKRLEERGEGAIWHMCIEADNIDEFYDRVTEMGIIPVDRFDKPIKKEEILVAPTGNRLMYLPCEKTHGTWIEIIERMRR